MTFFDEDLIVMTIKHVRLCVGSSNESYVAIANESTLTSVVVVVSGETRNETSRARNDVNRLKTGVLFGLIFLDESNKDLAKQKHDPLATNLRSNP